MENELSKILIFGGTGYIGKYMVKASVSMGHKTYVYARPITTQSSPAKIGIHKEFQAMGVTIVQGDIDEQEKIVSVLRQVDVVICTLAYPQVLDQLKIIEAMKVAGNIKRFFPSDFGAEEDRVAPLPPFEAFLDKKRKIRRATEAAGIPHTFVSANCFGAYFVNYLLHPHEKTQDIALRVRNIYFIHHPYCVNKNPSSLYQYRPQKNIVSQLELISLWEKKTGKTFNRIHVPEEEIIVELSKKAMENELSKILIFGGTGYIGKYMVRASVNVKTMYLITQSSPAKIGIHKEFQAMGVTIVQGDLDEQDKIVSVLRQVDVVICTLAYPQVLDQLKIIEAIKVAGNIKRFFPSDFGAEEDRVTPLPPFEAFLDKKRKIRRATEAAGIPHTFVSANCFGAYFVNYLLHPHEKTQDIAVYGSGEAKTVMNYEEDIAKYTIRLADDPRTCNRVVIYRPQKNIVSQLELISLWEKKTGKTFNRIHVPEDEIVELSKTLPHPQNIPPSILHSLFIKGDLMGFELGEDEVEASTLYPDLQFKTIDQLLDIFLISPPDPAMAAFE
uniref:NmrA-like domain-containing protein n=1 Tax=Salix viminalis TaxID=40686 RepID=A0A6N2ME73_SALVM